MLNVSREFKQMAYSRVKANFQSWIKVDGVEYKGSENFVQWSILDELNFASTSMSIASITLRNEVALKGKEVYLYFGYVINGSLESVEIGPYIIEEVNYDVKSNRTTALGYDKMIELCVPFDVSGLEYPKTSKLIIEYFCTKLGITTELTGLEYVIDRDLYTGTGHEYRSFLEDVAEYENNVFYFRNGVLVNKSVRETDIYLDKKRMREYQILPDFGPVDSLVLSRQPTEDNVYSSERPSDVQFEVKFNDNYLVDYDREGHVDNLFSKYEGMIVCPFEIKTIGLGFVELGDQINVRIADEIEKLVVYGRTLVASDSIQETLFTNDPKKTTTKYQYATDSERRQMQTEIIVDKQTGEIKQIVNDVEYLGEEVSEQGSHIRQTKDELYSEIVERKNQGDEILEETRANTSLLKDEFTLEFTRIDGSLDEVTGDLNEWKTTYQLNEDGATIGKNSSPLQITISNEQISFLDGGSATAWINGQMMYIRSLHILESIIIGHHQFIKYDGVQKSTLLKPTGSGEL